MARVPTPLTKPTSVWPIHRLADAAELRLGMAFRAAIRAMRASISDDDLVDAYRANNPNGLWHQAGWRDARNVLYQRVREALEAEMLDMAKMVFQSWVRKADAVGMFTVINERAVAWASREAARLVSEVDGETRQAIRAIIVDMQRGKFTYAQAARELRQLVGLTPQQSQAVYNFRRKLEARAGLIEDMDALESAFTPTQREILNRRLRDTQNRIDALVSKYDARLLRYRTETIARTESMKAANAGQQEAWLASQQAGVLPPDQRQEWLITQDERLCDICAPMENQTALLGQPFTHPKTGEQFPGPPLHPNCRCALALVISEEFSDEDRRLARELTVTIRVVRE